ncbi:hypothetical protein [Flavobacterium oreochromis]|uniref:hypothetical protein n=1 Tax=Flavobacterium oreochromis TaxID=2906078 RepID=UPI002164C7AA|nr:hypothetical protein [Flavobacterium oreochromis]
MKLVKVLVYSIVVPCLFFNCADKKTKIKTKEEYKIGKIYTMKPYQEELSDVDSKELKKVQDSMDYLYNKEFFSNDFSGSILVAKNGKILYEKYSGMSNFEKKYLLQVIHLFI